MGKSEVTSTVISTRALNESELDSLMASIGTFLMSRGFTPLTHSTRLLNYRLVTRRRGRFTSALVQVTDLPIDFSVESGSSQRIVAALAFGISAPDTVVARISDLVAPYQVGLDGVRASAVQLLRGKTFDKRVPGVACDHCGYMQEVTVPTEITGVEGNWAYGPGGSATVLCSNPDCRRPFTVDWDSVKAEIRFTE
jgi:hypothetical protein